MKRAQLIVAFAPVGFLTSCPPVKPAQPRLEAVRLIGAQVCGQFAVPGTTYSFTCPALPTTTATGWQLTPAWQSMPSGKQKANRIVVLTVSTPTVTQLQIDYEASSTAIWTLRQKAPGPGSPLPVSSRGEVEVDKTDDGTMRTWTITANMWLCSRDVRLNILNVSADGKQRSTGLSVTLLRPDEGQCESSGGGGGLWLSVSDPSPKPPQPPTQGPCPGNAPRTLFGICENCTSPPDPRFDHWTGVEACNWDEVLQTFDYRNPDGTPRFPKSQTCRPPTQTTREACEGP